MSRRIEPSARYRVQMMRPVKVGVIVYRPDAQHVMTGGRVLAVLAAVGVPEDAASSVLVAVPVDLAD